MHRALQELTITGIESSRDFHLQVMEDEEFRRGEIHIQWLERRLPGLLARQPDREIAEAAAIAAALLAEQQRLVPSPRGAGEPGTQDGEWIRAARAAALR